MALVGKNSEKNNQNLMQLIRRAHGLVENPDLENTDNPRIISENCWGTARRFNTARWILREWMRNGSA